MGRIVQVDCFGEVFVMVLPNLKSSENGSRWKSQRYRAPEEAGLCASKAKFFRPAIYTRCQTRPLKKIQTSGERSHAGERATDYQLLDLTCSLVYRDNQRVPRQFLH